MGEPTESQMVGHGIVSPPYRLKIWIGATLPSGPKKDSTVHAGRINRVRRGMCTDPMDIGKLGTSAVVTGNGIYGYVGEERSLGSGWSSINGGSLGGSRGLRGQLSPLS